MGQNSGSGLPTLRLTNPVATILLQLPSVSCLLSRIQNKSQGEWKGQNVSTNVSQMNAQLTSAVICISWEKDAPHMHLHMFTWLGLKSFIYWFKAQQRKMAGRESHFPRPELSLCLQYSRIEMQGKSLLSCGLINGEENYNVLFLLCKKKEN